MNARLRARLVLLAIATVLLPALPAGAARVVQVRIGEHPDFTRVVFELDAPAGYRVERKAGSSDLVVTLDAASPARKLARKSSDIRAVEVEAAEHAVARVRLSNPKLQLKEMILSNPPRIVLDVLREKPIVAAVKPKPKPAAKPAAEATKAAEVTKAAEAKPAPAPKPTAEAKKPAAPPKPIAETTKPAPATKPAAEAVPAPAPKPIAKAEPAPAPKPAPEAAKPAPAPKPIAEAAKPPAPAPPPATAKPPAPAPAPVAELKPPAPPPKALAETAKPPAPAAKPVAEVKPPEPPKPVVALKSPAPKAEASAPAIQIAEAQSKPEAPAGPTPPSAKPVMTAEDLAKLVAAAEKSGEEPGAKLTPPSPATPGATMPSPAKPSPPPGAVVEVAKPAPAPAPAKPAPAPAKLAPVAKLLADAKAAGSSWLSNPIVLGAAGGLLLCVIGLVFLRRRRALPNDLDVTAIAEEYGGADAADAAHSEAQLGGAAADDSFNLFGDDSAAAQQPAAASAQRSSAPMPAPDADSEASFASLFDDDELHGPTVSQGAASMSQPTSSDFPMDRPAADRTAATAARPASAVPGADVVRLVQDLERRMSLLEKKLGEANEAREKLERQVAAQSEELRVQRAAIARTQRALRTMTRGEEDKATEPALRDDPAGQTQSKTRINL